MTTQERYEAALKSIKDGEAKCMSDSTMNKRYKKLFALQDEIKAGGGTL